MNVHPFPSMPPSNLGPDWYEEQHYLNTEVERLVRLARAGEFEDFELSLRLLLSLESKGAPRPVDCGRRT